MCDPNASNRLLSDSAVGIIISWLLPVLRLITDVRNMVPYLNFSS
jgi:hypothetical protein